MKRPGRAFLLSLTLAVALLDCAGTARAIASPQAVP
jgi:hypothetical protein